MFLAQPVYTDPTDFTIRRPYLCLQGGWRAWLGFTVEEEEEDKVYDDAHIQMGLDYLYNNGSPSWPGLMLHDTLNVLDRIVATVFKKGGAAS
jgi:hypothetical protein